MNVSFNGISHSFRVKKGPAGYEQFTREIRSSFTLPQTADLNISFTCDNPSDPETTIVLQGPGAYNSAVHLAAISAYRKSLEGPRQNVAVDAFGSTWWATQVETVDDAGIHQGIEPSFVGLMRWRVLYQRIRQLLALGAVADD